MSELFLSVVTGPFAPQLVPILVSAIIGDKNEIIKTSAFCILSKIDCFVIVDFLLKNGNIKINQKSIHWHFFSFKYFIFQLFDDVLYCLFIFVMGYMNH